MSQDMSDKLYVSANYCRIIVSVIILMTGVSRDLACYKRMER